MSEMREERAREERDMVEEARDFLCSYRLCLEMLHLRRYERGRAPALQDPFLYEDILRGNEVYWRARMQEVADLIHSMRNGREKMLLYYRYIRGESGERAADLIGFSRRTGYRIHQKALRIAAILLKSSRAR